MLSFYIYLDKGTNMKYLLLFSTLALIFSCAHHRDVRPSSKGLHTVRLQTVDKTSGYKNAFSQATHFCKERYNKFASVSKESYKYTGQMSEDAYKQTKTAAKVAKGVGSAAWVFGGKQESNAGGIVGLGGQVADSVAGDGYTYTMIFKCD